VLTATSKSRVYGHCGSKTLRQHYRSVQTLRQHCRHVLGTLRQCCRNVLLLKCPVTKSRPKTRSAQFRRNILQSRRSSRYRNRLQTKTQQKHSFSKWKFYLGTEYEIQIEITSKIVRVLSTHGQDKRVIDIHMSALKIKELIYKTLYKFSCNLYYFTGLQP